MKPYSTTPPKRLRPPDAAVNDILINLTDAHYINNKNSYGLLLETTMELYLITHLNKCIRRVYAFSSGRLETTDTRNLTDKDYDSILCKIEDTVGMSIDELSHGRITYTH